MRNKEAWEEYIKTMRYLNPIGMYKELKLIPRIIALPLFPLLIFGCVLFALIGLIFFIVEISMKD